MCERKEYEGLIWLYKSGRKKEAVASGLLCLSLLFLLILVFYFMPLEHTLSFKPDPVVKSSSKQISNQSQAEK